MVLIPRIRSQRTARAHENGRQREIDSLSPAVAGSGRFYGHVNLGLAPQALCLRLLSQATKHHLISTFVQAVATPACHSGRLSLAHEGFGLIH